MTKKPNSPGWPDALAGLTGLNNPLAGNPLASSFSGGLEFMKNLWGGLPAAVPGFVVPTVDVEELDKRITDLKAVESWLAVNANMLRATIQSLEVQRNTVATLNALGGDLSKSAAGLAHQWANGLAGAAQPTAPAAPNAADSTKTGPVDAVARKGTKVPAARPGHAKEPAGEAGIGEGLSATAWLGFLQDQFNQVALAALAPATEPSKPKVPSRAAAPRRPPPAKRAPAKTKTRAKPRSG